jgi:hypothetical protein
MGNGALPNGPSYRAHTRLYLLVVSLRCKKYGCFPGYSGHAASAPAWPSMTDGVEKVSYETGGSAPLLCAISPEARQRALPDAGIVGAEVS